MGVLKPSGKQVDATERMKAALAGFAASSDRAVQDRYIAIIAEYLPRMHRADRKEYRNWPVVLTVGEAQHLASITGGDSKVLSRELAQLCAGQLPEGRDPVEVLAEAGPMTATRFVRRVADAYLEATREQAAEQTEPESEVQMVPADQLALLLDEEVNTFDLEFREKAPDLARMLDAKMAASGVVPFDFDIVAGDGVAVRRPHDLARTKPSLSQHLTDADVEALRVMTADLSTGEFPLSDLRTLTYVELARMLALVDEAAAGSGMVEIDAPAAETLRPVVQMEMDNRPK